MSSSGDGLKITIDTRGLAEALARLPAVQNREQQDILRYNARRLLKQVAYLTKRADSKDVPKAKRGRVGRLRAGWYASWKELGLPGMAYATPGAVAKFGGDEGAFGDQSDDKENPQITMTNLCPYGESVENFAQAVQNEVDRQAKAVHAYVDKKMAEMIAKHLA